MQGLKFKIGTTFALLLGVGMVLINIVLTIFWQRDMIRSEINRFKVAAAVSAEHISRDRSDSKQAVRRLISLTGAECVLIQSSGTQPSLSPGHCKYQVKLSDLARRAVSTGKVQTTRETPGAHFVSITNRYIFMAMPFDTEYSDPFAIAMAMPMKPLARQLVSNQKAVFLYILINSLILTIVGLARMVKVVIRPIERLAQLSETYTEDEGLNFLTVKEDNEFRRLSMSLNQMIERIEADKDKLKTTVRSLQAANQQLQDTQQEMVRTEKLASVGRLAAGLAHEIGNPVGIIQGYLGLIGQADVPDTEKKDYLDRAEKELERIGGLIRRLLDFSRSGRQTPDNVSVHQLLTESVEMFNIQSKKERVDIIEQFKAKKDTVFADPDQLRQVFLNCLLNAVDAVGDLSGEKRWITIITESSDPDPDKNSAQWVRVRVRDNGSGISKADLPKVFDPFFTTKEPGKGTGLGLFVSHAIIENAGGRMRIGSTGKAGTEVLIELPLTH
ncbi:MAG: ATP-binding protein [Thermodesulfobacteriota bacterium]|nr:ATP-binding protein [Thermodesulfobacteriota bacterium]